ncbi:hypothetical protein FJZ19_05020 [Candidatus Pacearchaeota archaeon]|nr:hypothetical protein [Candidatus Pacearchaeota archaeon]
MRKIICVGESRLVEAVMAEHVQGVAECNYASDVAGAKELIDSRGYAGMYMGSLRICRGKTDVPRVTGTDCDGGIHLVEYAVQRGLRVLVVTDAPERTRQIARDMRADVMRAPVAGDFIKKVIETWGER